MPATTEREEQLAEKLQRILDWCDAYPLEIFPEPDLIKARALLKAGDMTVDAISASAMRHVLTRIKKIIEADE